MNLAQEKRLIKSIESVAGNYWTVGNDCKSIIPYTESDGNIWFAVYHEKDADDMPMARVPSASVTRVFYGKPGSHIVKPAE
jgi:hypothetical protein